MNINYRVENIIFKITYEHDEEMIMKFVLCYCLEFLLIFSTYSSAKLCSEKLLDDKTKVPDSAFIESSYKDDFRGKWARESTNNEMAWCPKNQISISKKEFLIVDLGEIYVLKMIMTKGLSRHGYITASSYIIEYKRESMGKWIEYRDKGVEKRIKGNKDHLTEKYDSLDPSIVARWIKIYPLGENPVRICLVLQIYGCIYSSNVMEYNMVNGDLNLSLNDYNYDGEIVDNYLSKGLGKLVTFLDTKVENPFDAENDHFVGWSRRDTTSNSVTITFRFDVIRNFTSLKIETSNYYPGNVKTFSNIKILFSFDGKNFDQNKIINFAIKEDTKSRDLRFITVNLRQRIGRFIKIVLSFRSEWIIIRRVDFSSVVSVNYPSMNSQSTQDTGPITRRPINPTVDNDFFSIPLAYTLVIVISILIIMLLIGIPCVTIFIRRQKNRNKKCKEALQRHYHEEQTRFLTLSQQHFKDSIVSPGLFTVSNYNHNLPMLNNKMLQEPSVYTSLTGSDNDSNCPSDKQQYVPHNFSLHNQCPIINPVTNNRGISNDYSAMSFMTLGSNGASYMPYYNNNNNNAQLARSQINLRSQYDIVNPISTCQDMYPPRRAQHSDMAVYGPMQVHIQGPVGNSKYLSSVAPPDILLVSSLNQLKLASTYSKIELNNLKYIKTIGRGKFGSIHVAELTVAEEFHFLSGKKFVCNEYNSLRESLTSSIETENEPNHIQEKQVALVKVLSKDAPSKIKKEFYQEIKRLMSLNHKNFVSILNLEETSVGGCVVVSEYSLLQDVYTFLQCFNLSDSRHLIDNLDDSGPKLISQCNILFIGSQVASAMKHLESIELVHCDLGCRNVLVMNDQLLVKIADLAMSQDRFSSDYFQIDNSQSGIFHKSASCLHQNQSYHNNSCQNVPDLSPVCLLPIRWMAWQALIKGVFSNKSDVYAFGILFWELLTMCQKQPYHELTNEQVLINSNLQAHHDNRARVLSLPSNISNELADFISRCTQSDENKRPNFMEIDMFLQHKTIGYQSY